MSLHPDYPIVTGNYQMTEEWSVVLPEKFNRRIEEGILVLWRPALTFWINVWGNDKGTSQEKRLASILKTASSLRNEQQIERTEKLVRLTYELPDEDPPGHRLHATQFLGTSSLHSGMFRYPLISTRPPLVRSDIRSFIQYKLLPNMPNITILE